MEAKAYINHGRVIADCPYGCNNAYKVQPGQKTLRCQTRSGGGCHVSFPVEVPDNLDELEQELARRPNLDNRNWFPEDHPLAVRTNLPMGQTVADLRAEFEMEGGNLWLGQPL